MARLVVVSPGRGTYNRKELGYLKRFADHPHFHRREELAREADALRAKLGRITVSELDNASGYQPGKHLPGENASALIFTCSAADYSMLNPEHDVVGVLGNSMGWYSTLYTSGAFAFADAFRIVDTMGYYQKDNIQGGQVIYPVVDEQWRHDPEREKAAMAVIREITASGGENRLWVSIRLGGQLVFAGTDQAIRLLLERLPKIKLGANEYPFQLARHAAFHTPLMREASNFGLYQLTNMHWHPPQIPMIDGMGQIWRKWQTRAQALRTYTLVNQVMETYDFTASVRVALREYNPDHLVLLGPGDTLGGAIAQIMISEGWRGIRSREDFMKAQKSEKPPLIAMNRPEQAALVI